MRHANGFRRRRGSGVRRGPHRHVLLLLRRHCRRRRSQDERRRRRCQWPRRRGSPTLLGREPRRSPPTAEGVHGALPRGTPDVVVCDGRLPGRSGSLSTCLDACCLIPQLKSFNFFLQFLRKTFHKGPFIKDKVFEQPNEDGCSFRAPVPQFFRNIVI